MRVGARENPFPLSSPGSLVPEIDPTVRALQERANSLVNAAWAKDAINPYKPSPASTEAPQNTSVDPGQITYGNDGFASNVPRSLIGTESGGNWFAQNGETGAGGAKGHYGILQFGHARLEDGKRAGVIPASMTPEQFMGSRDAQVAMANWHFSDIDKNIRSRGYDQLVGQVVGGVPLSMDGMRAMAHLGGVGGLSKFIYSGGTYNPADAYGTSLAYYGQHHRS